MQDILFVFELIVLIYGRYCVVMYYYLDDLYKSEHLCKIRLVLKIMNSIRDRMVW